MPASNVYEVRCENCQTSFAPETKRCIHCGGPLGSSPLRWLSGPGAPSGAGDEVDEEPLAASRARNILWGVTAVLAVAMSLLRNCTQG